MSTKKEAGADKATTCGVYVISHGPKLVRSHFWWVNLGLHIEFGAGELEEAKSLLGFDIFCWDLGNIVGIFNI